MNEATKYSIIVIITVMATTILYAGLTHIDKAQTEKEAEIFFNGTMLGQYQIINGITQTNIIPFFNSTGHLSSTNIETLCSNLNKQTEGK